MSIAATASEAFERYEAAWSAGNLVQGAWNTEKDGRHLACALGVIGDHVGSPRDCPAQIMPRWLAQMVPWFFDGQKAEDAYPWGLAFYAELKRIDGKVPFSVVHDWQASVVTPLAIEVSEKRKRKPETHRTLQALHLRALAGDLAARDEWYAALKPAYSDAYAYANADAYANAYANADADAYANAYAVGDAYANAYAYAYADADAYADAYAVERLADGMVECLRRVPTSVEVAHVD